jgi:hypothetical protein
MAAPALSQEHHGGNMYRPYRNCAPCHGTNLEGADYSVLTTPSCFQCHDDEWDTGNKPPVVDAGGPYSAMVGQAVTVDASGSYDVDADSLTFTWDFGDGSPPLSPKFSPRATHSYEVSGTYTGTLTVGDGFTPPLAVSFTVEISEEPVYTDDVWQITTAESPVRDFQITIDNHDGTLVVLQNNGVDPPKVAVGIEVAGIIFWMDVWGDPLGSKSWASGSTYFANINRGSGRMTGLVSSGAGGIAVFSGQKW